MLAEARPRRRFRAMSFARYPRASTASLTRDPVSGRSPPLDNLDNVVKPRAKHGRRDVVKRPGPAEGPSGYRVSHDAMAGVRATADRTAVVTGGSSGLGFALA